MKLPAYANQGFGYIGLLIMIAIISLIAANALQTGVTLQRRFAEEELLNIGTEFRNALMSYTAATPLGTSPSPASLQDLLRDPRYPKVRRHLRKIYADPLTGSTDWGIIQSIDGRIAGVYSLSNDIPIKTANFAYPWQEFSGKKTYRDWQFIVTPQPASGVTRF